MTYPEPKIVTEVRSFLGLASYYRRFVKSFAKVAQLLHALTQKGEAFAWMQECRDAFEGLNQKLVDSPVLGYSKDLVMETERR